MQGWTFLRKVESSSTALEALTGGLIAAESHHFGLTGAAACRPVLLAWAAIGVGLIGGFAFLSSAVEVTRDESCPPPKARLVLHESRWTVFKLSLLFALDAFGGGFVLQSTVAYWFHVRFDLDPAMLGTVFLFANLLAGVSALAAGWLARRIGLLHTMVLTHLPSNVLLILVPLMPDVYWAVGRAAGPVQRFADGRADPPGLHDGHSAARRALRCGGGHGGRPVGRGVDLAAAGYCSGRQRRAAECPVLPRRGTEDRRRRTAYCCAGKLACCTPKSGCCVADAKLGCCEKGLKCCAESKACCAAVQKCCAQGLACCKEAKARCGPTKASAKAGCCEKKLACCAVKSACCVADAKLGYCASAKECCADAKACCSAVQKCCDNATDCCNQAKAYCGPKKSA